MEEYKQKMLESYAEILKVYTDYNNNSPWQIAYSGGKDSTVTTALVIKALLALKPEQRKRQIYITSSQTHLDLTTDLTKQQEYKRIKKLVEKHQLPVTIKEVEADMKNSFLYLVIGRGYPLPKNRVGRWCTDKLKIKPMEKFMEKLNPCLVVLGARRSESGSRKNTIDKYSTSKFYGHNGFAKTFLPIIDFTIKDVWDYLAEQKTPWGDAEEISQLYKDATGECGISQRSAGKDEKEEACGARFGCIVCPLVKIDKSTQEVSKKKPWFEPYVEIRNTMIDMYDDPKNRAGFMRNGKKLAYGQGTFSVKARMMLFNLFIEAERKSFEIANRHSVDPQPIFTNELIEMIHEQWQTDIKDKPYLEDSEELGRYYEEYAKGDEKFYQVTWNYNYDVRKHDIS